MLKTIFKVFPATLPFALSHLPAAALAKAGPRLALATFREAASRVPAYRQLLAEQRVDPATIRSPAAFRQLPVIDKAGYLEAHPLEALCRDGSLEGAYLIESGSGHGGKVRYWPRLACEDEGFPVYMGTAFRQWYQIDRRSTLMIMTLMQGTWTAGGKMSWALRQIAQGDDNRLTVVTPGMALEQVVDLVEQLSPRFEQTVLVGYPPFIRRVLARGERRGIAWNRLGVKVGVGGEHYSEPWRAWVREKIGAAPDDLLAVAGGYGAADLAMSVGREFPLSILVRQLAHENPALARDLFGDSHPLPSLCQYNPSAYFVEAVDGELVFTLPSAVPLVRYNIHDRGGVLGHEQVLAIVRDHGVDPLGRLSDLGYRRRDVWRLPFFYVSGRSDTVSLWGLMLHTEDVKTAFDDPRVADRCTGNFRMETTRDDEQRSRLEIAVELAEGHEPSPELAAELQGIVVETLEAGHRDYPLLRQAEPEESLPRIRLFPYQAPEIFDPRSIKQRYRPVTGDSGS